MRTKTEQGFTRFELLIVLCTLTFLCAVLLPAFGNRFDSEQAGCANNLRQIGQALHVWGNDHSDLPPWRVSYLDGGSSVVRSQPSPPWAGLVNNVWFQLLTLSNTLASPAVYVDPADSGKVRAKHWGATPDGGISHLNFRNKAVSYQIGLDSYPFTLPSMVLMADGTLPADSVNSGCSTGVGVANYIDSRGNRQRMWRDGLHPGRGNLLFTDGAVQQLGNAGLSGHLNDPRSDDNGGSHFLAP